MGILALKRGQVVSCRRWRFQLLLSIPRMIGVEEALLGMGRIRFAAKLEWAEGNFVE